MQMNKSTINMVEMGMRALHLVLSIFALTFVFRSFEVVTVTYNQNGDETRQSLATPTTNFIMLLTYSSMVYSFWFLVFVLVLRYASHMSSSTVLFIDTLFAIAYCAGSIAFVCLPFHKDCDTFTSTLPDLFDREPLLHCDNMTTSIVFCFVTLGAYVFSMMWQVCVLKHADPSKEAAEMDGVLTPAGNE